jgi:peroxiredoxin Q/BCP
MRRLQALLLLLLLSLPALAGDGPEPGQAAPGFSLQDQNGQWHALADYRGQWVVLYFYPKDDSPGCTKEACTFRDDVLKLRAAGAQVLGLSLDDVKSHEAFAAKYHLPFPLLADDHETVADQYGVLRSLIFFHYASRQTFLIGPDGAVAKRYRDVDPKENSGQVLADLAGLKTAAPH